ncbi:hypothetical protein EV714DRAFT_275379 [Schizophyllum commune]
MAGEKYPSSKLLSDGGHTRMHARDQEVIARERPHVATSRAAAVDANRRRRTSRHRAAARRDLTLFPALVKLNLTSTKLNLTSTKLDLTFITLGLILIRPLPTSTKVSPARTKVYPTLMDYDSFLMKLYSSLVKLCPTLVKLCPTLMMKFQAGLKLAKPDLTSTKLDPTFVKLMHLGSAAIQAQRRPAQAIGYEQMRIYDAVEGDPKRARATMFERETTTDNDRVKHVVYAPSLRARRAPERLAEVEGGDCPDGDDTVHGRARSMIDAPDERKNLTRSTSKENSPRPTVEDLTHPMAEEESTHPMAEEDSTRPRAEEESTRATAEDARALRGKQSVVSVRPIDERRRRDGGDDDGCHRP